jgi:hypothetical protein
MTNGSFEKSIIKKIKKKNKKSLLGRRVSHIELDGLVISENGVKNIELNNIPIREDNYEYKARDF